MSNEILSNSQSEDRIRSFWNIFRNAGPISSSDQLDDVVGSVACMVFTCEYPENFDRFIVNLAIAAGGTYEGDISAFCDNYRCSAELESVFDSLRARIPNAGLFVRFLTLLSGVSEGLTKKQVKYLGSQILDQALDLQRAGAGNFPATKEIAQLMLKLTESDKLQNSSVFVPYVPYPGSPSLVDSQVDMVCCVPNRSAAAIMAVHNLIEDGSFDVQISDPESDEGLFSSHQKYRRIIATPPFAMRLRRHWSGHTDSESFCIDQIAQNLKRSPGVAAICVTPGFLYRSSRDQMRIRRDLIESGLVDTVIKLPERLFRFTSIASVIIVLRNTAKISEGIQVIDASDCTLGSKKSLVLDIEKVIRRVHGLGQDPLKRIISITELVDCDFDLTPARHLAPKILSAPKGHTLVPLGDILRPLRTKLASIEDQGVLMERRSFPDTNTGFEFGFEEEPIVHASDFEKLNVYRKVTTSCLLIDTIAFRGEIRAFWFTHKGKDLFVRPDIKAMEVALDQVDPRWIALAINSKEISDQAKSLLVSTGIPRLRIELLLKILIAVPESLEQQKAIVRSAEELQIKAKAKEIGFERLLDQQEQDFLKDVRLKKHTLSQIARDIRSRVSVIKNELDRSGTLNAEHPIGRQGISITEYLDHIAKRCDDMGMTLESLTKILAFSPLEDLSLDTAFKALKVSCKGRHFKLEININKDSFKDQETGNNRKPIIQIAAKDFTELCENIFDNAERHGFRDDSTDHLVRIDAFLDTQEQMVVVSFKNTGQPLPAGLTTERFITRGEKGGLTGNTGIGGHHIKALMDHAKGQIEIRNLTEDLFRVEVKLTFPFQP